MNLPHGLRLALAGAVVLAASNSAEASLMFNLDHPVNGFTPNGSVVATFTDVSANTVQLTMDTTHLTDASEYIGNALVFNITPGWNFTTNPLVFSYQSGVQALTTGQGEDFTNGSSNLKSGLFDIAFTYDNANSANRFRAGETSVYRITANGLSALSFLATSSPDPAGPPGGSYAAADIRGIAPNGLSGSLDALAVPEPSTLALCGVFGLVALGRHAWRSRKARVAG